MVAGSGNVLDGDNVPADAFVESVNGVDVPAEGVVIEGQYGQLAVLQDGSYTYTPDAEGSGLGRVDQFEFIVRDTLGNTANATVNVQIGSADVDLVWDPQNPSAPATPVLTVVNDEGDATVVWQNVVDNDYVTVTDGSLVGLGNQSYIGDSFNITSGMEVSGSVVIAATAAIATSGTIYIERQQGTVWTVVGQQAYSVAVGVAGTIGSLDLADVSFTDGTYRVRVTGSSGLISLTRAVSTDVNIVYTDMYTIDSSTIEHGNLLENDQTGSEFTTIRAYNGTSYVDVTDETVIQGVYGTLTLDADGNYSYQVRPDAMHFSSPQDEVFTYQLESPTGTMQTGTLTVTVTPEGAGVVEARMLLEPDVIGVDDFDHDQFANEVDGRSEPGDEQHQVVGDDVSVQADTANDLYGLLEVTSADDRIPLDGLRLLAEPEPESDTSAPSVEPLVVLEEVHEQEAPTDPFSHLTKEDEWDHGHTVSH